MGNNSERGGRKTASGQKKNIKTGAPVQSEKENDFSVGKEILLLLSFGLVLLLFFSNFGICGKVGDWFRYVMFGLTGVLAYVFPIFLFAAGIVILANYQNKKVLCHTACYAIAFWALLGLVQLIWFPNKDASAILESFSYCGTNRVGGGLFGAIAAYGLSALFGFIGTLIVLIMILLIIFVLVTGKSIVNVVEKRSRKAYASAKTDIRRRREAAKEKEARKVEEKPIQKAIPKREKHELLRAAKQAKGIPGAVVLPDEDTSRESNLEIADGLNTVEEDDGFASDFGEDLFRPKDDRTERLSFEEPIAGKQTESAVVAEKQWIESPIITPEPQSNETVPSMHKLSDTKPTDIRRSAPEKETVPEIHPKETVGTGYRKPPLSLLKKGEDHGGTNRGEAIETAKRLEEIFRNFGVNVKVTDVSQGPSVTRYELQPEMGTKVSKITALSDDIKLNLAASDIRIEAPIPGKAAVGIEVPNATRKTVYLRDLIESEELMNHKSKIAMAAGKDISGKVVVADIAKMPHMLIAGTTGSGKSVFTNSIIMSILFRATPEEVRLIIVDPKVVEFGVYNGIPHLLIPVVTDPRKAAGALNWAVAEMSSRYKMFAEWNVRDLKGYNEKIKTAAPAEGEEPLKPLPQIVIIIDELADLMMVAAKEVEESICRLAQLARAAGIHLIIATQRPSVDVVTGLIKANVPSRVALLVSSGVDSRTIIDMNGAEKLLGNGDMLFYPSGYVKPVRLQGAFVSDAEVQRVVSFLTEQSGEAKYDEQITDRMEQAASAEEEADCPANERDVYFMDAARFVIEKDKASVSMLQRLFKIGFNRAARLMDQLAEAGVVGEEEGTKPRKVLMTMEELEEKKELWK